MKRNYLLILFALFSYSMDIQAQCATVDCTPVTFTGTTPVTCSAVGNCNSLGLTTEYLVVSNPDTIIYDALQTTTFNPCDYKGCVSIAPICYELAPVQAFVEAMNNSTIFAPCCSVINGFDANFPGVCDSITAIYTAGSQVQDLDDVLVIVGLFADTLTVDGFKTVVNTINDNIGTLGLVCTNTTRIEYCIDEVDFSAGWMASTCQDVLNLSGTTADPIPAYDAIQTVNSTGLVPTGSNVSYRAGTDINLNPDFEVQVQAEFSAEIGGDCAPAARALKEEKSKESENENQ